MQFLEAVEGAATAGAAAADGNATLQQRLTEEIECLKSQRKLLAKATRAHLRAADECKKQWCSASAENAPSKLHLLNLYKVSGHSA